MASILDLIMFGGWLCGRTETSGLEGWIGLGLSRFRLGKDCGLGLRDIDLAQKKKLGQSSKNLQRDGMSERSVLELQS